VESPTLLFCDVHDSETKAEVIGSGIMGERLASGNGAIALLANTLATGAALIALILTFGPISGAHFNPAVTLADATRGDISWRDAQAYIVAQVLGAFTGVAVAHLMFAEPVFSISRHIRTGGAQLFSECVATSSPEHILSKDETSAQSPPITKAPDGVLINDRH
jgi:glycerol uptake facilitator-like aquaporin